MGSDEYVKPVAERLSGLLWDKGIWNALRVWAGVTHDWHWWRRMIRQYIDGPD